MIQARRCLKNATPIAFGTTSHAMGFSIGFAELVHDGDLLETPHRMQDMLGGLVERIRSFI